MFQLYSYVTICKKKYENYWCMHDEINVWGYMELLPKYLTEQSNFVAFSMLFKLFVKVVAIFFLELNSKGLYLIPEKKENCCFVFTSSIKCEIRKFLVLCVGRQRNV